MAEFIPWQKYPGLTLDRLVTVNSIIRNGRHSAVTDHQPSKGDNGWTLGCVAYQRCCFAITKAAEQFPWLTILPEDQNRFTFAIGSIPMKFYRGFADDPPSRSLAVSYTELDSIQSSLDFGVSTDKKHILRLAIETDALGDSKAVILVELDEDGNGTAKFTIPEGTNVQPMIPKPVDPGPPSFTPVQQAEEQDTKEKRIGTERNAG